MDISLPAYQQVTREIRREIITGKLEPSQKLESIKDLASRFAVNHNTVQRALVHGNGGNEMHSLERKPSRPLP